MMKKLQSLLAGMLTLALVFAYVPAPADSQGDAIVTLEPAAGHALIVEGEPPSNPLSDLPSAPDTPSVPDTPTTLDTPKVTIPDTPVVLDVPSTPADAGQNGTPPTGDTGGIGSNDAPASLPAPVEIPDPPEAPVQPAAKAAPSLSGGNAPSGTQGDIGALMVTAAIAGGDYSAGPIALTATLGSLTATASASADGSVTFAFGADGLNALAAGDYPIAARSAENDRNAAASASIGSLAIAAPQEAPKEEPDKGGNKARPQLTIQGGSTYRPGLFSPYHVQVGLSSAYFGPTIPVALWLDGERVGELNFSDNGEAAFNIGNALDALDAGAYTLKASFPGNESNEPAEATMTLTILPALVSITGNNTNTVTAGGILDLKLYGLTANDGKATPTLTANSPVYVAFTVGGAKKDLTLQLTLSDARFPDNSSGSSLTLQVEIGSLSKSSTVTQNGDLSVLFTRAELNGLSSNVYTVTATVLENDYNIKTTVEIGTVTVNKATPSFSLRGGQTYRLRSDSGMDIEVELNRAYFGPTIPVGLWVGNSNVSNLMFSKNSMFFEQMKYVLEELNAGQYTLKASFSGNDNNEPTEATMTLTILPALVSITGNNMKTEIVGSIQDLQLYVLIDGNDRKQYVDAVQVEINGITTSTTVTGYSEFTVNFPAASLAALPVGVYPIKASIVENQNNVNASNDMTIGTLTVIAPKATPTLTPNPPVDIDFTVGNARFSRAVELTLTGAHFPDNNPASSLTVQVDIGSLSKSSTVTQDGDLSVLFTKEELNGLSPNVYTVTATVLENDFNNKTTVEIGTVTVNKATPELFILGDPTYRLGLDDSSMIPVDLSHAHFGPIILVGLWIGEVSVGECTFSRNSVEYASNFDHYLETLNAGDYTFKARFLGNDSNEPAEDTTNLTILPALVSITGSNAITETAGSIPDLQLIGSLIDDDRKLGGNTIQVEINGIIASATTVTGYTGFILNFPAASLAALPVGVYPIKASIVENQNNVNASDNMTIGTLTVEKAAPILSIPSGQSIKLGQGDQTLAINIENAAFVTLPGVNATLSIQGIADIPFTFTANGPQNVSIPSAAIESLGPGDHGAQIAAASNDDNKEAATQAGTFTIHLATPTVAAAGNNDSAQTIGQTEALGTSFALTGASFHGLDLPITISIGGQTIDMNTQGANSSPDFPAAKLANLKVGSHDILVSSRGNARNAPILATKIGTFTLRKAQPQASVAQPLKLSAIVGKAALDPITATLSGAYFSTDTPAIDVVMEIGGVEITMSPRVNGDVAFTFPSTQLRALSVGEYPIHLQVKGNGNNEAMAAQEVGTLTIKAQPVISIAEPAAFTGAAGSIGARALTFTLSDAYFATGAPSLTLHAGVASAVTMRADATQNGGQLVTFPAAALNALPAGGYPITVRGDANTGNLAAGAVTVGMLNIDPATPSLSGSNALTATIGQVGARDIEVRLGDAFATMAYPLTVYASIGTAQASARAVQNGALTLAFAAGDLNALDAGTHTIRAWTDGANADNNAVQEDVGTIKISKAKPGITGDASTSGVAGSLDDLRLTLALENASFATGEALAITLKAGGLSSSVSATANGAITFPLTAAELNTLAKGQYPIRVEIDENETNQAVAAAQHGMLTINTATPRLAVAQRYDLSAIQGQVGAQSLAATLSNAFVTAADPLTVNAYIGSVRQTVTAQANGSLRFDFTAEALGALGPGQHAITVRASSNGNNNATGDVAIGTLTIVAKAMPTLSGDNDLTAIIGHVGGLAVDLDVAGGNYLAGPIPLTAAIGGTTATANAGADGAVRITFADGALDALPAGRHAITVKSGANAFNDAASADIGTLTIEKQRLTISGSNTLSDWAGRPTQQTVTATLAGAPLLDDLEAMATIGGAQVRISVSAIDQALRFVFSPGALAGLLPGIHNILVSTEETASCEAAQAVVGTYTIRQSAPTISGNDASQVSYIGAVGGKTIAITLTNGDFSTGSAALTVTIGAHSRTVHATQDGAYYFDFPSWTLNALAAGRYPISATLAATKHSSGMTIQLGELTVLSGGATGPEVVPNPAAPSAKAQETVGRSDLHIGGDALRRQIEAGDVNAEGRRILFVDFAGQTRGRARAVITIDSRALPESGDITFIVETSLGRCIFTADAIRAWCESDGQCTLTLTQVEKGLTVGIENAQGGITWASGIPMMRIGVPYAPSQAENPALLALAAPDGEALPTSIYDDGMVHADIFAPGPYRVAGAVLPEPADWSACMQSADGWGYDAAGVRTLFNCNGTPVSRD